MSIWRDLLVYLLNFICKEIIFSLIKYLQVIKITEQANEPYSVFVCDPSVFSQPKQNQSCASPGAPEGKNCFKEAQFLLCCLLASGGERVNFILAHTTSRFLCNPPHRIGHAVKEAAYVQTELLVHHSQLGLVVCRDYGFNETRDFKVGVHSGAHSSSSWNAMFLLIWEFLYLYYIVQGVGIWWSVFTHLKKKMHNNNEHVGQNEVISGSLMTFFQTPPLQNLTWQADQDDIAFWVMNLKFKQPQ